MSHKLKLIKRVIIVTIFFVLYTIPQNVFAQSIYELQAQGKAAFRNGNYSLLEDKTREIIRQSPNHRWANLQLSFALRAQGKLEEALTQYQKTLDFNSMDEWAAYAFNGLGNTLKNLGRLQEAISAYNRAINLKQNHDYAYRNLGILFNELGKPREAIKYFKKQLDFEHKYPVYTYSLLADTLDNQGYKEEAIKIYKEVLKINSQDTRIYFYIGNLYASQNKINEAIFYYQQALKLPDYYSLPTTIHALTHTNLGIVLLHVNNLSEARIQLQKALDIDPNFTVAQENLEKIRQTINGNQSPKFTSYVAREAIIPRELQETVYEKFYSVVFIKANFCRKISRGTGWIVKREGNKAFILTNRHVVYNKSCGSKQKPKIIVDFFDSQSNPNSQISLEGNIVNISNDDNIDLAIIEVKDIPNNSKYQALKISSRPIKVDDDVRIIGHPVNADPWSTSRGYISSTNREKMQIPATLNSGNSGSPVLDLKTLEVVGIIYNVLPATEPGQTSGFGDAFSAQIIKEQLRIWEII